MLTHIFAFTVAGLIAVDPGQPNVAVDNDADKLQGAWMVVSAERGGKPEELFVKDKVVIEKDRITVHEAKGGMHAAAYKLDPAKKPREIDVTPDDDKNAVVRGIYLLEGDTLKMCFNAADKERPTAFETKEKTEVLLVVLKREKK